MTENEIGTKILDCAFNIHKEMGSGLYKNVYEIILTHELRQLGMKVERQVPIPIMYKNIKFDEGFKAYWFKAGLFT